MRRIDRVALAAAAAVIALAAGDLARGERIATARGVVGGGARNDGLVWITLAGSDLRFEALTDALPAADGLFAAAEESAAKSLDLTVRYDVESGFIDPATAKATFAARPPRRPRRPSPRPSDWRTAASRTTSAGASTSPSPTAACRTPGKALDWRCGPASTKGLERPIGRLDRSAIGG